MRMSEKQYKELLVKLKNIDFLKIEDLKPLFERILTVFKIADERFNKIEKKQTEFETRLANIWQKLLEARIEKD